MTAPYLLALHSPAANRTLSTVMPTDWSVLVARFRTVHSADHRAEHLEHRRAAGAIGGGDGGRVAFGREGCNLLCWVLHLGSSSRAGRGGSNPPPPIFGAHERCEVARAGVAEHRGGGRGTLEMLANRAGGGSGEVVSMRSAASWKTDSTEEYMLGSVRGLRNAGKW